MFLAASRNPLVRIQKEFLRQAFERFRVSYRGAAGDRVSVTGEFFPELRFFVALASALWPNSNILGWGQDFFPSVDSGSFKLQSTSNPTGIAPLKKTANLCDQVERFDSARNSSRRKSRGRH